MGLLRNIVSLPFVILGSSLLRISEFIMNDKITYRGDEVLMIIKKTAECTNCGHKGELFYKERI